MHEPIFQIYHPWIYLVWKKKIIRTKVGCSFIFNTKENQVNVKTQRSQRIGPGRAMRGGNTATHTTLEVGNWPTLSIYLL